MVTLNQCHREPGPRGIRYGVTDISCAGLGEESRGLTETIKASTRKRSIGMFWHSNLTCHTYTGRSSTQASDLSPASNLAGIRWSSL